MQNPTLEFHIVQVFQVSTSFPNNEYWSTNKAMELELLYAPWREGILVYERTSHLSNLKT